MIEDDHMAQPLRQIQFYSRLFFSRSVVYIGYMIKPQLFGDSEWHSLWQRNMAADHGRPPSLGLFEEYAKMAWLFLSFPIRIAVKISTSPVLGQIQKGL
jgi:hypothetical protein